MPDLLILPTVLAIVLIGNSIGSFFYISSALSGVDVAAVFSRHRSMLGIGSWFTVNTIASLVISSVFSLLVKSPPYLLIFVISIIIPVLSFIGRSIKDRFIILEESNYKRKLYSFFFEEILKYQKWALKPFRDTIDEVNEQKHTEALTATNDLRFLFGDADLKDVIEKLIKEKSVSLPSVTESLRKNEGNLTGQLLTLVKAMNLDILRLLLHIDKEFRRKIGALPKIKVAHKANRLFFDSIECGVFHISKDDKTVKRLNRKGREYAFKLDYESDDWHVIGESCATLFKCKNAGDCPIFKNANKMKFDRYVKLPCSLGKCKIYSLTDDSGFVFVKIPEPEPRESTTKAFY